MLNSIKRFFGVDEGYEDRYKLALHKFATSDNPYDVRLAYIFASNRNNMLDWNAIDEWLSAEGTDKQKMRDSITRFEALIK